MCGPSAIRPAELRSLAMLVGHELRTPLTVVSGYLSLATEGTFGPVPPGLDQALQLIEQKAAHARTIVEEILLADRLLQDQIVPSRAAVSLDTLLADEIDAYHLGSRVEVASRTRPYIALADRELCRSLLRSLLHNAVDATPEGQTVSCHFRRGPAQLTLFISHRVAGGWSIHGREVPGSLLSLGGNPSTNSLGLRVAHALAEAQGGWVEVSISADERRLELHLPATAP